MALRGGSLSVDSVVVRKWTSTKGRRGTGASTEDSTYAATYGQSPEAHDSLDDRTAAAEVAAAGVAAATHVAVQRIAAGCSAENEENEEGKEGTAFGRSCKDPKNHCRGWFALDLIHLISPVHLGATCVSVAVLIRRLQERWQSRAWPMLQMLHFALWGWWKRCQALEELFRCL